MDGTAPEPADAARPTARPADWQSPASALDEVSRLRAQAELRVAAAADVAQTLTGAREVADQLLDQERRAAEAMVSSARKVAQDLQAEKRRTAEAMVSSARRAAEQLDHENRHTAEAMVSEAEGVAQELHAGKRRLAEAVLTEAEHVAQVHAGRRLER